MASPESSPASDGRKDVGSKLQDALIRLSAAKPLASLSVSELCREAHVSRSAFYIHYSHIKEVYDDVVRYMMEQLQPFREHEGCKECMEGDKVAFCDFIRQNPEWRGIVLDSQFISTYTSIAFAQPDYGYLKNLKERGLTRSQAELLFTFHLSGCYAVALSDYAKSENFDQYRRMLDRYMRAGHDAICSRPR